jgi:NAD(P)-dependent dehydrogenase (short-subunit alcohol dehydrogenase family)
MAGRMQGKVAFITGAARGQGRSHALRLAEEGADIVAVDVCEDIATVTPYYPLATEEELAETVRQVEALDRRIVARRADVRDLTGLQAAFDEGLAEFGHVDTVVANAGIATYGKAWELTAAAASCSPARSAGSRASRTSPTTSPASTASSG